MINTTDFRASRRSASGSRSSGPSSRRLTEQELEIVRLHEENRQRDEQLRAQTEQLRAQSEYYASVHAQQQQMLQLLAQQQGIPYVAPPPPPQWTFVPMGPPPPLGLVAQQPQFTTPPAQLPAPGAQDNQEGSGTMHGFVNSLFAYPTPNGGSGQSSNNPNRGGS
ncbi:hypothetical protein ZEAMMB73_Zm00001d004379 [Zea mays]|uniref:Uncharacterized protein n=1 Tax=Zea mays TaxID=4577 RepID=A0A1D6EF06_MAIZE|nr:hypothetical protein ZEAMMB73_Zm00001d004379 [Zea mays]